MRRTWRLSEIRAHGQQASSAICLEVLKRPLVPFHRVRKGDKEHSVGTKYLEFRSDSVGYVG